MNAQIKALSDKISALHAGILEAKKEEKKIKADNIGFASRNQRLVVVFIEDVRFPESGSVYLNERLVIAVKNHGPKDLSLPFQVIKNHES